MNSRGSIGTIQILNWNRSTIAATLSDPARIRSLGMAALLSKTLLHYSRKQYAFLSIVIVVLSCISIPVRSQEIWMSAGPHINHPAPGWEGIRTDSGDLWKPDAPWATVANQVKVMGLVVPNLERVTDSDLKPSYRS
jgi:hypothetical protein